jgi:hypothetical protein
MPSVAFTARVADDLEARAGVKTNAAQNIAKTVMVLNRGKREREDKNGTNLFIDIPSEQLSRLITRAHERMLTG